MTEAEKTHIWHWERFGRGMYRRSVFYLKIGIFPKSRAGENSQESRKSALARTHR